MPEKKCNNINISENLCFGYITIIVFKNKIGQKQYEYLKGSFFERKSGSGAKEGWKNRVPLAAFLYQFRKHRATVIFFCSLCTSTWQNKNYKKRLAMFLLKIQQKENMHIAE